MKVAALISKFIPNDVARMHTSMSATAKFGWQAGKRCAKINNKNLPTDLFMRGKSIARNIKFKEMIFRLLPL